MHNSKQDTTKVSNTDVLEQYINSLIFDDYSEVLDIRAEIKAEVNVEIKPEIKTETGAETSVESASETRNETSQLTSASVELPHTLIDDEPVMKTVHEIVDSAEKTESKGKATQKTVESTSYDIPDDQITTFQICGVKFGINSNEIASIEPFSGMNFTVGNKSSMKLRIKGRYFHVLNTSKIVLPNKPVPSYKSVILLKDKDIGLTCDSVDGVSSIDESEIRRSSQSTQRKWLAGTVSKLKLALLDTDRLVESLSDTD